MTLENIALTSVAGIIGATMLIVEILKRLLRNVAFFQRIPTFVYSILIAALLTVVANRVIKLDSGEPLLAGSLWKLIWASVVAAAGASGFYSWLRNAETPLKESQPLGGPTKTTTPYGLLILLPLFSGCGNTSAHGIYREAANNYVDSAFHYTLEWAPMMVATPEHPNGQKDKLPTLSPADLEQIQKTHSEYQELYEQDRAADNKGFFPF